jgi:hypothetical protein
VRSSLVLMLCVLSVVGVSASGDTLPGYTLSGHLTFRVNRNATVDPNYDRLTFMLTGLTGPANGYAINVIEGLWTVTNGTFALASDAALAAAQADGHKWGWKEMTNNNMGTSGVLTDYGQIAPLSYINFPNYNGGYIYLPPQYGWGRTGSNEDFSSFSGSWFSMSAAENFAMSGGTTAMTQLYVKKGWTNVTFQGQASFTYGSGTTEDISLTLVPEPKPFAMAAIGLGGLGFVLWRRNGITCGVRHNPVTPI